MVAPFVEAIIAAAPGDAQFSALAHAGGLRWVSEPVDHLRRVFEFQALKGATYSARWGWSVDFVPVLKGKKLSWKRTAPKADFDLCINPIDVSGSVPGWCSFTASASRDQIVKTWRLSIDTALKDWERVRSRRDLVELLRIRSGMQFQRFGLDNYVQTHLAWGLVLLSLGDSMEGERHIAEFCETFEVDRDSTIIKKAEALALSRG
jgi:hypothetical protein